MFNLSGDLLTKIQLHLVDHPALPCVSQAGEHLYCCRDLKNMVSFGFSLHSTVFEALYGIYMVMCLLSIPRDKEHHA